MIDRKGRAHICFSTHKFHGAINLNYHGWSCGSYRSCSASLTDPHHHYDQECLSQ